MDIAEDTERWELLLELATYCGRGCEVELRVLSRAHPDLRIWRMVAASFRRSPPRISPIGYLRKAVATATAHIEGGG